MTIGAIEHLAGRYAELLPTPQATYLTLIDDPEATGRRALDYLREWLAIQLNLRRRLAARKRELRNLELLRECLDVMGGAGNSLGRFGHRSRFLDKWILACPRAGHEVPRERTGVDNVYFGPRHEFHVIVRLPESGAVPDGADLLRQCIKIKVPAWLAGDWSNRDDLLGGRIVRLVDQAAQVEADLAANRSDPRLINALNDGLVLRWYLDHTVTLTEDRRHCYVTGWTSADTPQVLQQALRRAHIDAVLLFRPGPPGRPPPVSPSPLAWGRSFRLFVNMLGTPGSRELDPTPLLAIIVPVLFGLMFSDIGHGLMLAGLGLVASRRYPALRFLVPCGLAAAFFGAVFGETFGSYVPVPALWVHPLDQPQAVLLASLGLGAAIILLGLALPD